MIILVISHQEAARQMRGRNRSEFLYPDSSGVYNVVVRAYRDPRDYWRVEYTVVLAYRRDETAVGTANEWILLPPGAVEIEKPPIEAGRRW